jgi:hypothetical protein
MQKKSRKWPDELKGPIVLDELLSPPFLRDPIHDILLGFFSRQTLNGNFCSIERLCHEFIGTDAVGIEAAIPARFRYRSRASFRRPQ